MNQSEIEIARQAIQLLRTLVPDDKIRTENPGTRRCPVTQFVERHLKSELGSDMTTAELWRFYSEVAAAGELESVTRHQFLKSLPVTMRAIFGVNKCHRVVRNGRNLRGFRGINIRFET